MVPLARDNMMDAASGMDISVLSESFDTFSYPVEQIGLTAVLPFVRTGLGFTVIDIAVWGA